MILPVIGILAFTGCSSIDGTAERQQATTNRMGTYLEQKQEQLQPADSDPDRYKFMIDHTVPFL